MTGSLEAGRWERVLHIPETVAETQGFDLVVSDTSFSFPSLCAASRDLRRAAPLSPCAGMFAASMLVRALQRWSAIRFRLDLE